jgi:hypothetical protein
MVISDVTEDISKLDIMPDVPSEVRTSVKASCVPVASFGEKFAGALLVELTMKLINFCCRSFQSLLAGGGNLVYAPLPPADILQFGFEQATSLQSVQQRVQRTRSYAITVVLQFLHHG